MNQDHAIAIAITMDQEMKTRMQKFPIFKKEPCCIFRVRQSRLRINKEAYQPEIVSIGPYHHGNKKHEMAQEQKWRYLQGFLTRTGKPLESFFSCIISMENEIRQSYLESIEHIDNISLARMMLLDGVFLIEFFRKAGGLISVDQYDPLFYRYSVPPCLMVDFLKLENQIPFFVLQKLFDESQTKTDVRTLPSLILEFLNYVVGRPKKVLPRYENLQGKHLLDLFIKSFIRNSVPSKENEMPDNPPSLLPATKLDLAGVKFKANHEADCFLDIEFRKGVLSIPPVRIDYVSTSFFLNAMAFEERYSNWSKLDITAYVLFLGCLINTTTDVGLLSIMNYGGMSNDELVKFFNNARKDLPFDIKDDYLESVLKDVNEYCNSWAAFMHKYCGRTVIFLLVLTALEFLLTAVLRTFFPIHPA